MKRLMRYHRLLFIPLLGLVCLPVRAFFFGSANRAEEEEKQEQHVAGAAGADAWLAGAFRAAESLFTLGSAAATDSAAIADADLMAAAAAFYGRFRAGVRIRRKAHRAALALRERYAGSIYGSVADAVVGDIAFRERAYARAAGPLGRAADRTEAFPEGLVPGLKIRAAYACLHGGAPRDAYRRFSEMPADSVIADYRSFWLGQSALRSDSTVRAILVLETLLQEHPRTLLADDVRWFLGEAYLAYGSYVQARTVYTELAGTKRLGVERNRARLMLAGLERRQGNRRAAEDLYVTVMRYAPETPWGRSAREGLLSLYGETGDSLSGRAVYYCGTVLAGNGEYGAALKEFDAYLERYPRSPILGTVRLAAAKALFGMDKFAAAEKRFAAIRKKYRRGAIAASAALHVARCRKERGDQDGARAAYLSFRKAFPKHGQADDALWYVAWNYEMDGDYGHAVPLYRQISTKYRKRPLGVEAVWRTGFCHYKAGEFDKAVALFRRYGKTRSAERRDKARFWMAMARFASGDAENGRANLRMAFENYPRSYYSVRAAAYLDSAGFHTQIPGTFDPAFDTDAVLLRTAAGVRERYLPPDAPGRARGALLGNARYRAGVRLLEYGFTGRGRAELVRVEQAFKNDAGVLLALYGDYVRYGVYDRAYRTAYRALGRIHKADIDGFPRGELRLMFMPAHFGDIAAACAAYSGQPDPYLAFALMHRESAFDPEIVSPAGATGLMQIMPGTGAALAAALGDTAFVPDQLAVPETSIRLGTRYLADLWRRYADAPDAVRVLRVLAAYNAGPDAVDAWLVRTGGSHGPERYVEELEYRETRAYVRKVMRSLRLYRDLWDDYCRR